MASVSETGFGQRLRRGRQIFEAVGTIEGYAPSNQIIKAQNFARFLESIDAANTRVAAANASLSQLRNGRSAAFFGAKGIIRISARVRDFLASTAGGKNSAGFKTVQKAVQRLRNYRKPVKEKEAATPQQAKKGPSRSELSFGSMLQNAKEIREAIKAIAGYAPSAAALSAKSYAAAIKQIEKLNAAVARAKSSYDAAVKARYGLYEGTKGLRRRITAIKSYVSASYGRNSQEYARVKQIKY